MDSFLDFHHVQEWKLYKRVAEVYKEKPMVRPEIVEKIRGAYEEVKDKFMEPVCEKCGTTRPQTSWSRLDTASMALKAGDGLDQLYLACYLFPTLQSHATVSSLFTRMKATPEGGISFDEGPQKGMVDWALVNAHGLILRVIDTQTEHFRLGLDAPLQVAIEDFKAIWKSSPDEAAKTPTD